MCKYTCLFNNTKRYENTKGHVGTYSPIYIGIVCSYYSHATITIHSFWRSMSMYNYGIVPTATYKIIVILRNGYENETWRISPI